jgi:hypothetical protein
MKELFCKRKVVTNDTNGHEENQEKMYNSRRLVQLVTKDV